jgi:hypothetical protein
LTSWGESGQEEASHEVVATSAASAAAAAQTAAQSCDSLASLSLPETTQITAQLVTTGSAAGQTNLPQFCRVQLTVAPQINIEVWLPTQT